ncbi:MAG: hypothetical protein IKX54_05225 [Lachnospiraceae bacterium]|nr:hypothetical protein [Lachnospiraceae bacterium]
MKTKKNVIILIGGVCLAALIGWVILMIAVFGDDKKPRTITLTATPAVTATPMPTEAPKVKKYWLRTEQKMIDAVQHCWRKMEYDENGNILRSTEYNFDGSVSGVWNYTKEKMTCSFFRENGDVYRECVVKYDDQGRKIDFIVTGYYTTAAENMPSGATRRTYEYYEGDMVKTIKLYSSYDGVEEKPTRVFYYDEFGNEVRVVDYDEAGNAKDLSVSTYDESGEIELSHEEHRTNGEHEAYYRRRTFEPDGSSRVEERNDNEPWETIAKYDASGRLVQKIENGIDDEFMIEIVYDDTGRRETTTSRTSGNIVSQRRFEKDRLVLSISEKSGITTRTEYQYDAKGNCIYETAKEYRGEEYRGQTVTRRTFSENGTLVRLEKTGDISHTEIYEATLDENGLLISEKYVGGPVSSMTGEYKYAEYEMTEEQYNLMIKHRLDFYDDDVQIQLPE